MRTMDKYRLTVRLYLIPSLGHVKLSALNKMQVQRTFNKMGDGDKPPAPKSIHDTHGILHRALQQAVKIDIIAKNPSDNCKLPRMEKKEIKPILLSSISSLILLSMFGLLIVCVLLFVGWCLFLTRYIILE